MSLSRIGLIGLGTVGEAFYQHCQRIPELKVTKVCVRRKKKKRGVNIDKELLVKTPQTILTDPDIDLIVELIDDAEIAFEIAKAAIIAGKPLISANKRMLAENLQELLDLQRRHGTPVYCEASVAASIPIVDTLCSHYGAGEIESLQGVLNGSCNFILGKIAEGVEYPEAVRQAQRAGFAESDPGLDVEGWDATYKTSLLAYFGFGHVIDPQDITRLGIENVQPEDLEFAVGRGSALKLVGNLKREKHSVSSWVGPALVTGPIASVSEEYNGVELKSTQGGTHFLSGKGAGGQATALSVISDCLKAHRRIRSEAHWPIVWRKAESSNARVELIIRTSKNSAPEGNWGREGQLEAQVGDKFYWKISAGLDEVSLWGKRKVEGEFLIFLS